MGLLRFVLALAVVAAHTQSNTWVPFLGSDGGTPVAVFYVISGFYMALVLNTKYLRSTLDFYRNRFLRLFPIYWVCLLFCCALALAYSLALRPVGPFYVAANNAFSPLEIAWAGVSNISVIGSDVFLLYGQVTGRHVSGLLFLAVIWSLGCEVVFYAICPLFARSLRTMIALLLISMALRLLIAAGAEWKWTAWNYYFFPSSALPFFLSGAIAYRLSLTLTLSGLISNITSSPLSRTVIYLSLPLAVAFWGLLSFPMNRESLIAVSVVIIPLLFAVSKSSAVDARIGDLSYPIYLIHFGALIFWAPLRHFIPQAWEFTLLVVVSIVASALMVGADGALRAFFVRALPFLGAGVPPRLR